MVVPLRDGASREEANSLALRLSRLPLSLLLHNKGGIVVHERLVKGDTVRASNLSNKFEPGMMVGCIVG